MRPGSVASMRSPGIVVAIVAAVALAGCAPGGGAPGPGAPGLGAPGVEYAPLGTSAIAAGCADLLPLDRVAGMSPEGEPAMVDVIDENRIAQDMSVAALQAGALRCVWSNNYGGTDFKRSVWLTVWPSTETTLDAATEPESYYGPWNDTGEDIPTLFACEHYGDMGNCSLVQLRAGYRIELIVEAVTSSGLPEMATFARRILAGIGDGVDAAGPARAIAPWPLTDVAAVCAAPEITAVVAARGGAGAPQIAPNPYNEGVVDCSWQVDNPYGSTYEDDYTLYVSVLPGGAWAMDRLATGVGSVGGMYQPVDDYLLGTPIFSVGAMRTIGNDLVRVIAPFRDDDPEAWERAIASAW